MENESNQQIVREVKENIEMGETNERYAFNERLFRKIYKLRKCRDILVTGENYKKTIKGKLDKFMKKITVDCYFIWLTDVN